jgi:hypothetical protein
MDVDAGELRATPSSAGEVFRGESVVVSASREEDKEEEGTVEEARDGPAESVVVV